MHQAVPGPQAPEWGGLHLLGSAGKFGQGLNWNAVAGADIMQKEIAEWMNDLVAERCRNEERAAVD